MTPYIQMSIKWNDGTDSCKMRHRSKCETLPLLHAGTVLADVLADTPRPLHTLADAVTTLAEYQGERLDEMFPEQADAFIDIAKQYADLWNKHDTALQKQAEDLTLAEYQNEH